MVNSPLTSPAVCYGMHPTPSRPRAGFTLTELAVVLVIIGLLLGAVMAGRDLIRHAEINASLKDIEKIKMGVAAYKMRRGLPGDHSAAEQRWGSAPSCPGNASSGTCNGNGNGRIDSMLYTGSEATFFWQHLGLAGLIEGSFAPNWPLGSLDATYAPHLTIEQWGVMATHGLDDAYFYPNAPQLTYLLIGRLNTQTYMTGYANPAVTCYEARAIDGKIDDEKPSSGMVQGLRTRCTDTLDPLAASSARYTPTVNDETILGMRAE